MSNLPGNRMSTPETSHTSTLRPPSTRTMPGGNAHLRASADMTGLAGTAPSSRIRPSSDFYGQTQPMGGPGGSSGGGAGGGGLGAGAGAGAGIDLDPQDKLAQEWIADIDQYETTLEEMAAATLDQDFKDELSAIEQWFRVLSEAERTAALYALLQQTTQVQIRFFIQVLRQMGKNHPMSGVLSPANFDKDPMSNRLSDAMNKLSVDSARNSMARSSIISVTRQSGLDPSTINAMFPDAAAAIATEKAKYTQQTGTLPVSNRNSTIDRNSLVLTPTISTPADAAAGSAASAAAAGAGQAPANGQNPISPAAVPTATATTTGAQSVTTAPTSQPPMGQFVQPPPSAGGLRSPLPPGTQNTTLSTDNANNNNNNNNNNNKNNKNNNNANPNKPVDLPLLSPYGATSGNWASMVNTPMVANFNQPGGNNQADMVANATAMKLAALSTVNNRVFLDDVRKYRRTRSTDGPGQQQQQQQQGQGQGGQGGQGQQGQASPGAPTINLPGNMVMVNEAGQMLRGDSMLSIPSQTPLGFGAHRSRPNSPGIALQSATGFGSMPFSSPQTAGFLSAYDGAMSNQLNLGAMNLGQLSAGLGGMGNMGNLGNLGNLGMGGIGMGGLGGLGSGSLNPPSHHHEGYLSDHSDINRGRSPRGRRGSSKPPEDPTDPTLLQDIPSWLRSLRLHKYTDNLKDMKWTDLVELDDKQLEDRGVNALGARRKMLKVFEQVKEAKAEGKL